MLPRQIVYSSVCLLMFLGLMNVKIAGADFDPNWFESEAVFEISIPPDTRSIIPHDVVEIPTRYAFAILTDELFSGKYVAIEIFFFDEPVTEEMMNLFLDTKDQVLVKHYQALMTLLFDQDYNLSQVNLTCVIPGWTAGYTVLSGQKDIAHFKEKYSFDGYRLKLQHQGAHEKRDPRQSDLKWNVDVDLPVFKKFVYGHD